MGNLPEYPRHRVSYDQIASWAAGAGFTGSAATKIVAIARAESGGDEHAAGDFGFGYVNGGHGWTSFGLTQVHLPAHPQYSIASMMEGGANLRAAYEISGSGRSFTPWTTYVSGTYLLFMAQAAAAVARSGSGKPDVPCSYGGFGPVRGCKCPEGYTPVVKLFKEVCTANPSGKGVQINEAKGLSVPDLLHNLPAYLKIAGGGVIMVAGVAVLLVGATGSQNAVAATAMRTPAGQVIGRRRAVRARLNVERATQAREEANVRVRRENVGTPRERVVVARRRKALREAEGDNPSEGARMRRPGSSKGYHSIPGPSSRVRKDRVKA